MSSPSSWGHCRPRRVPAGLVAAIAIAGCASAPREATPIEPPTVPARWTTDLGPGQLLAPAWWQAFGDAQLNAWVERALAHNADVATAAARVQEARAQERLARSQRWPALNLSLQAGRARELSPFGEPEITTSATPAFQAAYELDLFGRIDAQLRAAQAGTQAAEDARAAAALAVASATVTGYVTLCALQARLQLLADTLTARAEARDVARHRAEVGYTSDLERQQAEADYEATAQQVPAAQAAFERQAHALALLAGDPPGAPPTPAPLDTLVLLPVPAGLPSDLLRRRPDIASAEATLAATDASLAAARAQFLPQVRLSGSIGPLYVSALDAPVTLWSVGASVLAPLFSAGRLQAGVEASQARQAQAAWGYRRTVLTAFREVEDQLTALHRLDEQRVHLEAQRDAAREALRHARNRYRAGYSAYLEQLDAQRTLLSVELALVQLRSDALTARVALAQAMGGGWSR